MRTRSPVLDDERRRAGERLGVHRQHVELGHLVRVGPLGARVDAPLVQHDGEVAVDAPAAAWRGWMTNMPVIPSAIWVISSWCEWYIDRAVLAQRELVLERLAGRDRLLVEAADAVHAVRQQDAVPVHRRRRGQPVRDVDAHAIALDRLDHRAVDAAVVAPAQDLQTGGHLVIDLLGDHVEDLHAADDLPGQLGAVGHRHRHVVAVGSPGGVRGLGGASAQQRARGRASRRTREQQSSTRDEGVGAAAAVVVFFGAHRSVLLGAGPRLGLAEGGMAPPRARVSSARADQ